MLYHQYIETVLGSQVKIKMLRALLRHPSKKFTIRELAKFIGVTHTPVLRSMKDLQGMNLINLEKHGTANLLALNTSSHLYPILNSLFSFEHETLKNLINKLRALLPPIETAVLFGSLQKGAEKIDSDIDLLIITENKKEVKQALDKNQARFIQEFGNILSPILLTLSEFKKKKSAAFAKEVIKDYTLIKGEDMIRRHWL